MQLVAFFKKKMPYCGQPVKVSVSVSVYLLARKKKCTVIAQGGELVIFFWRGSLNEIVASYYMSFLPTPRL